MLARRLARIFLVIALVSVQTVYAGHSATHNDSGRTDCQFCLHASNSAAALPGEELNTVFVRPARQLVHTRVEPAPTARIPNTHHARAPPVPFS